LLIQLARTSLAIVDQPLPGFTNNLISTLHLATLLLAIKLTVDKNKRHGQNLRAVPLNNLWE
jgi:hypothetical protein